MYIKTKYRLSDNSEYFFAIEADIVEEDGIGWCDTIVDLCSVRLNDEMGIRLNEIPADLKNELEEQCRKEYQVSTSRKTERMQPLRAY